MYSDWLVLAFLVAVTAWIGVLSYKVSRQNEFLRSLLPRSSERDIRKKFAEILVLEGKLESLEKASLENVQKIGLVRFNPYEDTGGDQSFAVALLNGEGTGVVVTSLHNRSGTRVFAKEVIKGGAGRFQFSKEEVEVIEKAIKS